MIRGRKGEYVELFRTLQTQGFSRARVNGETYTLDDPPTLDKQKKHTIEVVVDRLAVKESSKRRLTDSVETALNLAGGLVIFDFIDLGPKDAGRELKFSEKMACPNDHPIDTDELEPRSFSFNSPFGACPECHGLGTRLEVDPDLVVPDPTATLGEGAIQPWSQAHVADYFLKLMAALGNELGFDLNTPWEDISAKGQQSLLFGHSTKVHVVSRNRYGRERAYYAEFEGVQRYIERRHREAESDVSRERFEGFMREVPCPACGGSRLKPVSVAVTLGDRDSGGKNIADVCALPINEAADYLRSVELSPRERQIAERVLKEILERLNFLLDVGLDYLSLNRPSGSLSGGEAQRIRLATQIGAGLVGVLYVLDEPSIGLHQRDNQRLIETLVRLKDLGNTLIVVEHDEDTIRSADWVVDIGPGAGEHGGQVVHSGSVQGLLEHRDSPHGSIPLRPPRDPAPRRSAARARPAASSRSGAPRPTTCATSTSRFPLGLFVSVTGVSGLGQVDAGQRHPLHLVGQADLQRPGRARAPPDDHGRAARRQGDRRRPVARSAARPAPTRRPTPASSTTSASSSPPPGGQDARLPPGPVLLQRQGRPLRGVLRRRHDQDRDELPARRLRPLRGLPRRPLQPRDARGALQGQDHRRDPRHDRRGGRRLLRDGARDLAAHGDPVRGRPRLRPPRSAGHHPLRRRGAAGQARRRSCRSARPAAPLYVLDEPTTGLHFEDIRKLLLVLGRLVDLGNSMLVIEHNLDVIKTSDWIIDMGPEGGSRGGMVVAEGTPEDVAAHRDSYTGHFLKPMLDGREAQRPKARVRGPGSGQDGVEPEPARKTAAAKKDSTRRAPARADDHAGPDPTAS